MVRRDKNSLDFGTFTCASSESSDPVAQLSLCKCTVFAVHINEVGPWKKTQAKHYIFSHTRKLFMHYKEWFYAYTISTCTKSS